MCAVVDGTYDAFTERLEIAVSPTNSPQVLQALRALTEQVRAGRISLPEAQRQAENIKAGAGKLFDIANWSDSAKATLYSAIIAGFTVLGAAAISKDWGDPTPPAKVEVVIQRDGMIVKGHPLLTGKIPIPTPRPRRR